MSVRIVKVKKQQRSFQLLESENRDSENSNTEERAGDSSSTGTVGRSTCGGRSRGTRGSRGGGRARASSARATNIRGGRCSVVGAGKSNAEVSGEGQGSLGGGHVDGTILLEGLGVHGQEHTSVHDVLHELAVCPLGNRADVVLATPVHDGVGSVVLRANLVHVRPCRRERRVVGEHLGKHGRDGVGAVGSRGVEHTPHASLTVTGSTAVVEDGGGVVDGLLELEAHVLLAGSEGVVSGLVARKELRRLGDGVVVGPPHEVDGVTRGNGHHRRNEPLDTLSRRNDDSVGLAARRARAVRAGGRRGSVHGGGSTVLSNAFYTSKYQLANYNNKYILKKLTLNTVVVARTSPSPAVVAGTVALGGLLGRCRPGVGVGPRVRVRVTVAVRRATVAVGGTAVAVGRATIAVRRLGVRGHGR